MGRPLTLEDVKLLDDLIDAGMVRTKARLGIGDVGAKDTLGDDTLDGDDTLTGKKGSDRLEERC